MSDFKVSSREVPTLTDSKVYIVEMTLHGHTHCTALDSETLKDKSKVVESLHQCVCQLAEKCFS